MVYYGLTHPPRKDFHKILEEEWLITLALISQKNSPMKTT